MSSDQDLPAAHSFVTRGAALFTLASGSLMLWLICAHCMLDIIKSHRSMSEVCFDSNQEQEYKPQEERETTGGLQP